MRHPEVRAERVSRGDASPGRCDFGNFEAGIIALMRARALLGFDVGVACCDVHDGERAIRAEVANLEIGQTFLSSSRVTILKLPRNNASDVAGAGTICGENRAGVLEMRRHRPAILGS